MTVKTHPCLGYLIVEVTGRAWCGASTAVPTLSHFVILPLRSITRLFCTLSQSDTCLKGKKMMFSHTSPFSLCMDVWKLSGYCANNQCHMTGDGGFFEVSFNFGTPCMKEQQGGKGVLPSGHSSFRFIPRLWSLAAQDVINNHCKPLIDKQEVLREEDILNGEQERLYANCF